MTTLTDLVVVVIESGRNPPNTARRMKDLLRSVHAPVVGFVLNGRTSLYSDTYGNYDKGYYSGHPVNPDTGFGVSSRVNRP